ncbi:hypothetical protein ES703_36503 [subsurface metagenome]
MGDKEFIVSHAKAREPITVRGKNLEEALEKEGLDPNIWREVSPPEPEEHPPKEE